MEERTLIAITTAFLGAVIGAIAGLILIILI